MDSFDQIPDPLLLQIFNSVSDVKSLALCRGVSRRFNTLVPHSESLLLRVDRVVSPDSSDSDDLESLLLFFLKSLFKSIHALVSPKPLSVRAALEAESSSNPTRILRGFDRIRELDIELPAGDFKLDKGTVVRYKAVFGSTLKHCVMFGFGGEKDKDFAEGLKERVVWIINALIAASTRHAYVAREVVSQHGELERLVVRDRESEGEVLMDAAGLSECRVSGVDEIESGTGRTAVPCVKMQMRHLKMVGIGGGGDWLEGATLVVVRPSGLHKTGGNDDVEDADLAIEAFGSGVYGEVIQELLKSRSYMLEMNSF